MILSFIEFIKYNFHFSVVDRVSVQKVVDYKMEILKKIERQTKLFYLKSENVTVEEMSARLFWIPNSLVIWMGCNIFSEDFTTKTIKFSMSMLVMVVFTISQIYSLHFYRNNFPKLLFTCIGVGLIIQTFGKLYAFIIRRPDLMKLVQLCKKFLAYCENGKMRQCFDKWIMIGFHAETILSVVFVTTLIFFLTYPVFLYLIFDSVTLIFAVVLPFTDDLSNLGYTINYAFQILSACLAILAFLAAIMDVVIFVVHFLAFYEVLEILLDALQDSIKSEQTAEVMKEKDRIMKKLIEGHNWCYEYLDGFESSFQFYHLCDIASSIFSTVLCLYGVTTVSVLIVLEFCAYFVKN